MPGKQIEMCFNIRRRTSLPCYDVSIVYDIALKYELTEVLDNLIENGLKTHCDEKYRENDETRKPERLIQSSKYIGPCMASQMHNQSRNHGL